MHLDVGFGRHDGADEVVDGLVRPDVLVELHSEQLSARVDGELGVDELLVVADEVKVGVSNTASLKLVHDMAEGRLRHSLHPNIDVLRELSALDVSGWQTGLMVMLTRRS